MNRLAAIVASALVLMVIVGGLLISGSPATQRELRLDQQRINDLRRLSNVITQYWQRFGELPAGLDSLVDGMFLDRMPVDPVTRQSYEYRPSGVATYSLCADFTRPTVADESAGFWRHPAGRHCFDFALEPTQARLETEVRSPLNDPVPD